MSFEVWAIVELFGHTTYAGKVTEETIGGASFIRVDVPEVGGNKAFTKYFGANAIYAITPVDEEVARLRAESLRATAVQLWQLPDRVQRLTVPDDGEEYIRYDDEELPEHYDD